MRVCCIQARRCPPTPDCGSPSRAERRLERHDAQSSVTCRGTVRHVRLRSPGHIGVVVSGGSGRARNARAHERSSPVRRTPIRHAMARSRGAYCHVGGRDIRPVFLGCSSAVTRKDRPHGNDRLRRPCDGHLCVVARPLRRWLQPRSKESGRRCASAVIRLRTIVSAISIRTTRRLGLRAVGRAAIAGRIVRRASGLAGTSGL